MYVSENNPTFGGIQWGLGNQWIYQESYDLSLKMLDVPTFLMPFESGIFLINQGF